jgi:transposase
MPVLKLATHLSAAELKERLGKEKEVRFFQYWQILHAVAAQPGIKAKTIAPSLGTSASTVRRIVQLYNKQGAAFMEQLHWGGRREALCYLSLEEETALLQQLQPQALQGAVLVAKQLRPLVEQKTGCAVSKDYLRDLLQRHHWKKKAPRPKHPKGNDQEQEAFKKKHPAPISSNRGARKTSQSILR